MTEPLEPAEVLGPYAPALEPSEPVDPPGPALEPTAPTPPGRTIEPAAMLCGRNIAGKPIVLRDVGTFNPNALMPVTLETTLDVELEVNRGNVEICIGRPHPPTDPIDPAFKRKISVSVARDRPTNKNWGKKYLKELTAELVGRHLPSYFEAAGKSAEEMAADMIEAKELARAAQPGKRQQESLDRMYAELTKRLDRLRREEAERARLARLAEAEVNQIGAALANSDAAVELFMLRARFEEYIGLTNKFTLDRARETATVKLWQRADVDFGKIRDLVHASIHINEADKLRAVLAELDALYKIERVSDLKPGERRYVSEVVSYSTGVFQ